MRTAARVFRALADPTRRQILEELKAKELAAGEIGARFEISAPSISRHLAILKAAELVSERRDGNRILYRLAPEPLLPRLNSYLTAGCPPQAGARRPISCRRRRGARGGCAQDCVPQLPARSSGMRVCLP